MSQVNAAAATDDFEFAALQEARNYRAALAREFGPQLKGRVVEVGAGVGQMTSVFRALPGVNDMVAIEPDPRFQAGFRAANPDIRLIPGVVADLPDATHWDALVAINVLEHIEHDLDELKRWHGLLADRSGAVCLFIPARPEIYAPIDRDFGHFRRYTKPELRRKLTQAGFTIERLSYFNWVGYFAWLLNFRLRGQRHFDTAAVRLFDSKIFPAVHWMESRICRPPFGQSLIAVGRAGPSK